MSFLAPTLKVGRDRWARRTAGIFFAVALPAALHAAALPPALLDCTDKYCSSCHNDEDKKGRLDLTSLTLDLTATSDFSTWVKVHDRLGAGEMPPKEKKRPDAAETAAFLAALREALGVHDIDHPGHPYTFTSWATLMRANISIRVIFPTLPDDRNFVVLVIDDTHPPIRQFVVFANKHFWHLTTLLHPEFSRMLL
jgi:hypothetical protein